MIKRRQEALNQGNIPLLELIGNRIDRGRKIILAEYYKNSILSRTLNHPLGVAIEVKKLRSAQFASKLMEIASSLY